MTVDLWPDDIGKAELDTKAPVTILKQQASLLGEKTQNLVGAQVRQFRSTYYPFSYTFLLTAPALDNYTYELFSIAHDADLYPVTIDAGPEIGLELSRKFPSSESLPWGSAEVQSEGQLLEALRFILGAKRTRNVIGALLAQMADDGPWAWLV